MKTRNYINKGYIVIPLATSDTKFEMAGGSESWLFYALVSEIIIAEREMKVLEKYKGPFSCRIVCEFLATRIFIDFDDMMGTSIKIHTDDDPSRAVTNSLLSSDFFKKGGLTDIIAQFETWDQGRREGDSWTELFGED